MSRVPPVSIAGDGHAERRRFDQHAAERFRSVGREREQLGMPDPFERALARQPAQHAHADATRPRFRFERRAAADRRRR
jgi:hypothetical protein